MTQLTHWKKLENPDYIGSYAFQPGEKKTLTIKKVTREVVTGAEGKKETCTIVHWSESEKPLILNATNGKAISKVLGAPYIEQWAGGRVILAVESVKAFGDLVDAVRVQKQKPAQEPKSASPANCTDCGKVIEAYGSASAEKIVAASTKRYGCPLCTECAVARTKAAQGAAENTEVTPDENDANQDQ